MGGRLRSVSLALAVAVLALPAGGLGARAAAWQPPTLPEGAALTVTAGQQLRIDLVASAARVDVVDPPAGGVLTATGPGRAVFTWTPGATQLGQFLISFVADDGAGTPSVKRTFVVWVAAVLSRHDGVSRWAFVDESVPARTHPHAEAPVVSRLPLATPERTRNLVLALARHQRVGGEDWVQVRLAVLPNNTTGWVPRSALGSFHAVRTHLVVDRARFTATLYRNGRPIFRTRVGVGKSYWPTPKGEFYVRNKLTGFRDPLYGVLAFGTSARSNVLTDWPGGGYIGIHGTFKPELLPGRVSHGCVRLRNDAILRLAKLMPVGTPLTIR